MSKRTGKKTVALFVTAAMLIGSLPGTAFAAYSDTEGHWAQGAVDTWSAYGIVQGDDRGFRPDDSITRGEMAVVLNKLMQYQTVGENKFADLGEAFYTEAVLKANAAGVLAGDGATMRPTDNITRQEAASLLGRVFGLEAYESGAGTFTDADDIADWAKGMVGAMAAKGYVTGFQGKFQPAAGITRAEVVTILNNIVKGLYQTEGEYTENVTGTVVVNAPGVTLKHMSITGDLILAEGIGTGDVTLESVTVSGQTFVRGGGDHTIHILGNSKLGAVKVEKTDAGAVRVLVEESASVDVLHIDDGKDDIIVSGTLDKVVVSGGVTVVFQDATVDEATVSGTGAVVTVDADSKVTDLTVEKTAADATLTNDGTIRNLDVSAPAEVTNNGTLAKVEVSDAAKIENKGTIKEMNVTADDVIVDGKKPESVTVADSVTEPPKTSSGTNITGSTPSGGSGGGSGDGGGSSSSYPKNANITTVYNGLTISSQKQTSSQKYEITLSGSGAKGIPEVFEALFDVVQTPALAELTAIQIDLGSFTAEKDYTVVQKNPALSAYGDAAAFPENTKTKTYKGQDLNDGLAVLIQNGVSAVQIDVYEGTDTTGGLKNTYAIAADVDLFTAFTVNTGAELKAALADTSVRVVTLGGDVETTEKLTVASGGNVTLDLNGKTLTADYVGGFTDGALEVNGALTLCDSAAGGKMTSGNAICLIHVKENGKLTVSGGSYVLDTVDTDDQSRVVRVEKDASATISDGAFQGRTASTAPVLNIRDEGVLDFSGGTVTGRYGISLFGSCRVTISGTASVDTTGQALCGNSTTGTAEGFRLDISGDSVLKAGDTAVYLPNFGTTVLNGGTITGEEIGISIRAGKLTVNSGTIAASGARNESGQLEVGQSGEITGALVLGKPNLQNGYIGDLTVDITGGTIRNENGDAIAIDARNNPRDEAVSIQGLGLVSGTKVVITDPAVFTELTEADAWDISEKMTYIDSDAFKVQVYPGNSGNGWDLYADGTQHWMCASGVFTDPIALDDIVGVEYRLYLGAEEVASWSSTGEKWTVWKNNYGASVAESGIIEGYFPSTDVTDRVGNAVSDTETDILLNKDFHHENEEMAVQNLTLKATLTIDTAIYISNWSLAE